MTQVGEEAGLDGAHGQPAAIGGFVEVVPGVATGEQAVAGPGLGAVGQVFVDGQRHERQDAVGDRHVEVGALAGGRPGGQCGTDGGHRVQATASAVGHRRTGKCRAAVATAARAVEVTTHGQVVEVVARPLGPWAGLAEASGRAQHDAGIHGAEGLVADAQTVDDAGAETLDDHIGVSDQLQEGVASSVGLEVQQGPTHAPVCAVGVGRWGDLHAGVTRNRPHLDDVGTPVGQPASGAHRWPHRGEVQHGDPVEKGAVGRHGRMSVGLEVLGEAQAAAGDDVLLHLRGAAANGVQHGVPVGRLGSPSHGGFLGADPKLGARTA